MRIFLEVSQDGSVKNIEELTKSLLPYCGKWVQVEAKPLQCAPDQLTQERRRTLEQNNYYWGVVIPAIAKDGGNDPDAVHEGLKEKYLTTRTKLRWDKRKILRFTRSTTTLVTKEFSEFILKVRKDFGVLIDGQRYSIIAAPNQSPDFQKEGFDMFLIDPVELSKLENDTIKR